jgi:hypothetical protein
LGCAVYCAVIWGRISILTVSVMLSSNLAIVQFRCAVCCCAVIWGGCPF